MKLYDVEIPRLNNEYLLKGKKSCVFSVKFFTGLTIFFGIAAIVFLFVLLLNFDSNFDSMDDFAPFCLLMILLEAGGALLTWFMSKLNEKRIIECDAEIEKRLTSGELSQQYVDSMFRSKTKEEKKESRITWIFFGTIIAVILFIVVGCTISSQQDNPDYDDVFNKDPNNWSDNEKDYVNDLFDYMKEND